MRSFDGVSRPAGRQAPRNSASELTAEQRRALDAARQALAPHFAGEVLKLYVPKGREQQRRQAELAAVQVLQRLAESPPQVRPLDSEIARRLGLSVRTLRRIRARIRCQAIP